MADPTTIIGQLTLAGDTVGKVIDMSEKVGMLQRNKKPFLALLAESKGSIRKAQSYKVQHLEDQYRPQTVTVTSQVAADGTALVTNQDYLIAGRILLEPSTKERIRVVSRDSANHTTISRNWGGGTLAGIIAAGATLIIVSDATGDGSAAGTSIQTVRTEHYNYVQCIQNPVELSHRDNADKTYGLPNPKAYYRNKGFDEHELDIESMLFFGKLGTGTDAEGKTLYTANGLDALITTNRTSAGGTLTQYEFDQFNNSIGLYNPGTKRLCFASPTVADVIKSWAEEKLRINDIATKRWGMVIEEYVCGACHLVIIRHPKLTVSPYNGYMFAVDPEGVALVVQEGEEMGMGQLWTDKQVPGTTGTKDIWRSYVSLEFRNEINSGVLYGVTG